MTLYGWLPHMKDFLSALALLTIYPLRLREVTFSARALAYYPLVGLLMGVALVAAQVSLRLVFPPLIAATLLIALWTIVTGALHLDGFSDACDALFASTTRERRLEILRDVHLGAFGAAGLILLLITKVTATAGLATTAPVLLAPILARWAIVYAATYPLARRDGMAALFCAGLTRREISVATLFAMLAAGAWGGFGLGAFVAAFLTTTLIARVTLARLDGLTGDIYGMICESVELAVLLVGTATGR